MHQSRLAEQMNPESRVAAEQRIVPAERIIERDRYIAQRKGRLCATTHEAKTGPNTIACLSAKAADDATIHLHRPTSTR
jgi:hypothetical protein